MNVFELRNGLISDYSDYISSFIQIKDQRIREFVDHSVQHGLLWPDPLVQLNPSFEPGKWIDELVSEGLLSKESSRIFRRKSVPEAAGDPLRLHKHQEDAIRVAKGGHNYLLTTGTGSGKSLAYIIPIVDHVLRNGSGKGIQAIIVYPMNALANSQLGELEKFINYGYPDRKGPVRFARYTGQESDEEKNRIMSQPPDILLTNYVMLELILTRTEERRTLVNAAQGLRFLVLDELHTYRGRQGADVAMLVRRVREALHAEALQCIGTSATLIGTGGRDQQKIEIAQVASRLFGDEVKPEHVIGETLKRATIEFDFVDPQNIKALSESIINRRLPSDYENFKRHPLASWIESTLGIHNDPVSRGFVRAEPRRLKGKNGLGKELAELCSLDEEECISMLQEFLLLGYKIPNPETGFPSFAFRLHQFISRGDTVYASLEEEDERHITVNGQRFVPGDREAILLPLAFCRECGQEYYVVERLRDPETNIEVFRPRDLDERKPDHGMAGFLYVNATNPWPEYEEEYLEKIPEQWVEMRGDVLKVKTAYRQYLPETFNVKPSGEISQSGVKAVFVKTPFRFCLNCGVTYGARQTSDFPKLTELSSGGRSTDTTILSLSLVRRFKEFEGLERNAKKLLSFTDNRQDASLQAGHFNDFVDISMLRSALYRATQLAGEKGIQYKELPQKIFEALNLPLVFYANNPEVKFLQREQTDQALRDVLGYRVYRDLKRGWRITSPNLEQCGLLKIEYQSLRELCQSDEEWADKHPALATASAETREKISKVLLDFMRRELSIKIDYLSPTSQDQIRQSSNQLLISPWAIDENEQLDHASILFPRSRQDRDDEYGGNVYLSGRSGFGQYLRRPSTFIDFPDRFDVEETETIIDHLLKCLLVAGLVIVVVDENQDIGKKPGYQLQAAGMLWLPGDGSQAFHDPIRVPALPESGGRTNSFFVKYYRSIQDDLLGVEAREHTAQVPYDQREDREERFRKAELPVLFCSPTMELGIDIAQLNAINMRNVPPTPANYAQRSGRAGRSGQPALVFTYCTMGSPHDQYYFKRQEAMVAGAVTPPRIDLNNEDLVRSHIQSIWLASSGLSLGRSLKDLLELSGENSPLEVTEDVRHALVSQTYKHAAKSSALNVMRTIENDLQQSDWWDDRWMDMVLDQIELHFNQACERWRNLYRSAKHQQTTQQAIINDTNRSQRDRNAAKRLRQEAENQIELLIDAENIMQSDFYSYRYFASEGFLPGYSFPRLPLSAYVPARRIRTEKDEFLSRPRFLAISEFGPRSIIYHEGSRYVINKVNLTVSDTGDGFSTVRAKQCRNCGYLHPISNGDGLDRCEHCHALLEAPYNNLFKLQNVSTRRRDRISSDEEERQRQGYELRTAFRFAERAGEISARTASVLLGDAKIGELTYGPAATLWRINLGWSRRTNSQQFGFNLDIERGYWARKDDDPTDTEDPMTERIQRVVPFVEDHKNCLIYKPEVPLSPEQMASLQAALKNAIQVEFQLEDNELAAEPLPDVEVRNSILFYEAAEGGAGILRNLMDDPLAFARIARRALTLCHFDPETGEDLHRVPNAREDCEAACYDCLLSYFNQRDHQLLDRHTIVEYLMQCAQSTVQGSPSSYSRGEHLRQLLNLCQSDLEREWLGFLEERGFRLPSQAQKLMENCGTRPDFLYETAHTAIYVDGYHHLDPQRQLRDQNQQNCLEDMGFSVIRFGLLAQWDEVIKQYPSVFGEGK